MFFSSQDFPGGSDSKASAYNARDLGSIPGLGRSPGERNGNHSSTLAWKILWSLVVYNPWDRKELDMTEQLHFHLHYKGCNSVTVRLKIQGKIQETWDLLDLPRYVTFSVPVHVHQPGGSPNIIVQVFYEVFILQV